MYKIIIILLFFVTFIGCNKRDMAIEFPSPPYPYPDITICGNWDVRYEWRCLDDDYVVVIYYFHSYGEWKKIEDRTTGVCIF